MPSRFLSSTDVGLRHVYTLYVGRREFGARGSSVFFFFFGVVLLGRGQRGQRKNEGDLLVVVVLISAGAEERPCRLGHYRPLQL